MSAIGLILGCAGDPPRQAIGRFEYAATEGELVLAGGGVPQLVIVAMKDAPMPVRFAAEELKEHLDRMTGGDFSVVDTVPDDGKAIVLGDGPEARDAGIDVTSIARDGYAIRTVGPTIFIAGFDDTSERTHVLTTIKSPLPRETNRYAMEKEVGEPTFDFQRGTLYGVYRFLDELGVRWFFPGPKGTVIPPRKNLSVRTFSLTEEPHYVLRKAGTTTWAWYYMQTANYTSSANPQEYDELGYGGRALRLWLMRNRGSSEWFAYNHRPPRMELEERYGGEHPEYFAVRENGARDLAPETGRTGHLCYNTEGVFEITTRDIDAYLSGKTAREMGISNHMAALNPYNRGWSAYAIYGRSVSLLPHDSFRGCECPECRALTRSDLPFPHHHTRLLWPFVIRVAKWMEEAYPENFIICLAYASYTEPYPELTSLPSNIVVGLCPAYHARTHNDLDDAGYRELMRLVGAWSGMNRRPMLIWLHHLYRFRRPTRKGVPMLITEFYNRLFKDLAPHANMMQIEMDWDSIMLEHLNRYVMIRLMYNPNLDAAELVRDYAVSFYGPEGSKLVLPLLADVEERSVAVGRNQANAIDIWEKHFTEEAVAGYRRQADALVDLTAGTRFHEAADLFSRYFVGEIEAGRRYYVDQVKNLAESESAHVGIRPLVGAVKVDGVLDEPGWGQSGVASDFVSNINGQAMQYRTEVRLLRSEDDLYFAFTCYDPDAGKLSTDKGASESIEFFLDLEHDHDSYYWVQIDGGLRVEDWYIHNALEPPDKTWVSGVEAAVQHYDDRWVMEVRLPRKSMKGGLDEPVKGSWGVNFCRSMKQPPRENDRYSSWSPLLRGLFHQPDLFGHVSFE